MFYIINFSIIFLFFFYNLKDLEFRSGFLFALRIMSLSGVVFVGFNGLLIIFAAILGIVNFEIVFSICWLVYQIAIFYNIMFFINKVIVRQFHIELNEMWEESGLLKKNEKTLSMAYINSLISGFVIMLFISYFYSCFSMPFAILITSLMVFNSLIFEMSGYNMGIVSGYIFACSFLLFEIIIWFLPLDSIFIISNIICTSAVVASSVNSLNDLIYENDFDLPSFTIFPESVSKIFDEYSIFSQESNLESKV